MNFKSLLLAGSIGLVTLIGGSAPVQATPECRTTEGFTACRVHTGKAGDVFTLSYGDKSEEVSIRCNVTKYEWNSFGTMDKDLADAFAKSYCENLPRDLHHPNR